MANLTRDAAFSALIAAAEASINTLANAGVRDAHALVLRQKGWNNLQGHARALIPLALWFIRAHPAHLASLRKSTSLRSDMGRSSREARNRGLWQPIQADLRGFLSRKGSDIITVRASTRSPQTAQHVANTYLSDTYGGGQTTGQAGNTVFKRTLKLLAHILP